MNSCGYMLISSTYYVFRRAARLVRQPHGRGNSVVQCRMNGRVLVRRGWQAEVGWKKVSAR